MGNEFGNFIKQKRQEKNLTQKRLSEILFVSESAVSKWEKGAARPDITLLPKLSEILGVSEHEIITASIDKQSRVDKIQAKRWRTFVNVWNLFFFIAYVVALIPCVICNLVIDKTLSWFFIVLSSLILAFTFTNLPTLIKKHKLILLPLSMYLALCLLLGVCCIYVKGAWFWIPVVAVLFGLIMVFLPIYVNRYAIFDRIRKYNDFFSIAIDFVVLNILLVVIYAYTAKNLGVTDCWYLRTALPIVAAIYLYLNLILCVRFLRINNLLKTSVVLFLISLLYAIPPFVKVSNPKLQNGINDANVFMANLSTWDDKMIEKNVHLIILLTLITLSVCFLIVGLLKCLKKK